jgi:zinc protease
MPLDVVEDAALRELDAVRLKGVTLVELARAKHQLRARLVFESDSVTSVAHQLGYFETIARVDEYQNLWARIEGVTLEDVSKAAQYLRSDNRTVGWFQPTVPTNEHIPATEVEAA